MKPILFDLFDDPLLHCMILFCIMRAGNDEDQKA